MSKIFFIIFKKELKDNFLNNKAWFTIAFFLLCLLVFPLSFGVSTNFHSELSIPAIWVSALFANLIALDQMYKEDYSDGTLTYYLINDIPFSTVVIAKCLSHWFFCGAPIIILSPFCLYVLSGSFFSYNLNMKNRHSKNRYYEDLVEIASSKGGKVISFEYLNNNTKMVFECSKGHDLVVH